MNVALNSSGAGYILSLCPSTQYLIDAPLVMTAPDQEISTQGYPIEQEDGTDERATLVVNGPVSNGEGHTTAITGERLLPCFETFLLPCVFLLRPATAQRTRLANALLISIQPLFP